MKTLKLSMMGRWGLDELLGKQEGTRKERRVYSRVRGKITVLQSDRLVIAGAFASRGDGAFDGFKDFSVVLETEEVAQLLELGNTVKLPVAADVWMEPIMEQLEAK